MRILLLLVVMAQPASALTGEPQPANRMPSVHYACRDDDKPIVTAGPVFGFGRVPVRRICVRATHFRPHPR
jgi:hypothetical protein